MTPSERYAVARAEIQALRKIAAAENVLRDGDPYFVSAEASRWDHKITPSHVLRVLDAASGVLDRHRAGLIDAEGRRWCECGRDYWVCGEAEPWLDLFASEPAVSGLSGQAGEETR